MGNSTACNVTVCNVINCAEILLASEVFIIWNRIRQLYEQTVQKCILLTDYFKLN
jgi:hypothetical protein